MKFAKLLLYAAAAVLTVSTGCKKFLERPPQGQLTQDQALSSEQGLVDFMNGIYGYIGDGDYFGGRYQTLNELLGDQLKGDKFTGDYAEIYKRQNSFFGGTRDAYYTKAYKIIDKANVALENLGIATTQKNSIQGQALFFRGMAHFELVRLFAQPWGYTPDNSQPGIPLKTHTGLESVNRSSVKDVYMQVIADLKGADSLLPSANANGKFYLATKWAAKAYLAKVYFQMNDFANAFKYADDVIRSNKFQLDATYDKRYSLGLSTEGILVIADNTTGNYHPGSELRSNFKSNTSIPVLNFTDIFYNYATSRATDVRKAWYSNTLQAGYNVTTKFNKDFFELPVIHLTEIKLIRAEAGAELGGASLATGITDINDILTRAYGGTTQNLASTASAATVIATTRTERELELVGEGDRVQEIKRIGARNNTNVDRRGSPWNCNGLILQFPKNEQDANFSFQMNPEGGCF
jgi:tetratricopeptide (TPR) repeat protein